MKNPLKTKQSTRFVPMLMLALALSFVCCTPKNQNPAQPAQGPDSTQTTEAPMNVPDSLVSYLLDACAADFHKNQPPLPLGFRHVEVKSLAGPDKQSNLMICGEFLSHDKQNNELWTAFATIKTSGYEQWIGNTSLGYCNDASVASCNIADLSLALKNRLDSLQKLHQPGK